MTDTPTDLRLPEPGAEPDEHARAMIAKAEAGLNAAASPAAERPAWLPADFETPEQLATAWRETAGPAAAIDIAALAEEYEASGQLSDESYAGLEAGGLSRAVVDAYIAGQAALQDRARAEIVAAVGGEAEFDAMRGWAAGNLSPADLAAYNGAVNAGREAALLAVQGVMNRFRTATGGMSRKLMGASAGPSGPAGYASQAEMTAEMRDPRYERDPAFRKMVEGRVRRSIF